MCGYYFDPKYLMKYLIKLLSGPTVFLVIIFLQIPGLQPQARLIAALYIWLILWWCLQPVPWSVTALVPLLLLPVLDLMSLKEAATFYGQSIMYLLLATFLLAEAINKSGLGKRITFTFLSLRWVKESLMRLVFVYMCVTFILAATISASALAIVIPMGIATISQLNKQYETNGVKIDKCKLGALISLATLYGAEAGFVATPLGAPHNIVSISLIENLAGYSISFFQWMQTGIIIGMFLLLCGFTVVRLMFNPGVDKLPCGMEYFCEQKRRLGKWKLSEWIVTACISVMLIILVLSSFVKVKWLDLNWVVMLVGILLFVLPTGKNERVLTVNDLNKINWNILLLATTGVALAGMLQKFGFIEYVSGLIADTSGLSLVIIAAVGTVLLTNFVSGLAATVSMCTIVFPVIGNSGIHPVAVARIIPDLAVGMIFPWAGVTAALTFSSGYLKLKDMIKGGLIVTFIYMLVVIIGNMTLVPLFKAYSKVF